MNTLTIIAAVAEDRAIGYGNKLLYWLPDDLKRFKALTTGNTIIMGRKTFESLPKGALPNRRNIVLSRSIKTLPGCEVFTSLNEALRHCEGEDVFIIGGATVYAEALPYADRLCLTEIHDTPEHADAFFPEYSSWREVWREEHHADEKHSHDFAFVDYEKQKKNCHKTTPLLIILLLLTSAMGKAYAQVPSIEGFSDGIHHWNLEHKDRTYNRLAPEDYEDIADNLLRYQNTDGGWPKNIDWLGILSADSVKKALKERYRRSTLDNRNTFPQIEYLADVYSLTGKKKYRKAAERGLEYILSTQKDNGGWRGWDVDAITFNDEVTTGALSLFLNIIQGDSSFTWLGKDMRRRIADALDRGIDMILRCQYVQNGKKTAWGQQHDNVTLLPVKARTFELPGLTARESCDVIRLLMAIQQPSDEVREAIRCAIAWLKEVRIYGMRVEEVQLPEDKIINHEYPFDRVTVKDEKAPPIWARYYELSDNTPFLSTREGKKVWRLEDVNAERRTGYDWYGYWPQELLDEVAGQ